MNLLHSHTNDPFAPTLTGCGCGCHACGYAGGGMGALTLTANDRPTSDWSCHDWMYWHKRLVEKYGREGANEISQREWDKQSWWTHTTKLSWCKFDDMWVEYYKKQGVDAGNIFSDTSAVVGNLVDTAKSTTQAAENTANVLKWALPAAILVIGGGVIWYLAQSRKTIGDIALSRLKR